MSVPYISFIEAIFESLEIIYLNRQFNRKLYWAILKRFLTVKKIRCIPPLLYEGKFVTDFQVKSEIFNSHFDLHF